MWFGDIVAGQHRCACANPAPLRKKNPTMAKNHDDASATRSAPAPSRCPAGRRPLSVLGSVGLAATLATLTLLTGCASLFEPVNQEVALRTSVDGERVEAACEVKNDKGRWTVTTPVNLAVTRSSAPLVVECHGENGLTAFHEFTPVGSGSGEVKGSNVSSGYPFRMELALAPLDPTLSSAAVPAAAAVNPADIPYIDADGRAAYARFIAGDLPRAFAVSDKGQWIRVNGARSAGKLAMDRCVALGGNCGLYAVDNDVIWENRHATRLAASR